MDFKIIWSERSLNNLKEVLDFIAQRNPSAANYFGNSIVEKTELLVNFPKIGRIFAKLSREDVREISVPPYRIIYQILESSQTVSILTVWHGARQDPELCPE